MIYRVKEIFVSIKGEGRWLGYPMQFIRLAECNLRCEGCDTEFGEPFQEMSHEEIVAEIRKTPQIQKVVITGGEPTLQDLSSLVMALNEAGYSLHLETNGAAYQQILSAFNWIALSPKSIYNVKVLGLADEVKIPIVHKGDLQYADKIQKLGNSFAKPKLWYLHPWNAKEGDLRTMESVDKKLGKICAEYAATTGRWLVSIQAHKYLEVR